jgi:hypothetical protein
VPDTLPVGIALTGASIIIMPLLAWAKRRAGQAMNSRLVVADAAETRLCAWLSVSTFAGLVAFAVLGWTWIDAVVGFVIAGLRSTRAAKPGRANSSATTDVFQPRTTDWNSFGDRVIGATLAGRSAQVVGRFGPAAQLHPRDGRRPHLAALGNRRRRRG